MKISRVPDGTGGARRAFVFVVALGLATILGTVPVLAHGEEGDTDPADLVEQALAIVVNTPDASGEALERVEAALEAETEEPSGELDLAALEEAARALEEGRLHDAEDALVAALGQDPHPDKAQNPALGQPTTTAATPATTEPAPQAGETPDHDDTEKAPGHDDETPVAAEPAHGLTSRVEGGLTTPGPAETAFLLVAAVLALGGVALVRGKE